MAEIQKRTETVTQNFYRLDLTQEEAEVLYVVLGSVAGPPAGYAGTTTDIFNELHSALGVIAFKVPAHRRLTGSLRFEDTK